MFQASFRTNTNTATIFDSIPTPLMPLFTVALWNGEETIEHHNMTEVEATALAMAIEQAGYEETDHLEVIAQGEVLTTDWFTVEAVAGSAHLWETAQSILDERVMDQLRAQWGPHDLTVTTPDGDVDWRQAARG